MFFIFHNFLKLLFPKCKSFLYVSEPRISHVSLRKSDDMIFGSFSWICEDNGTIIQFFKNDGFIYSKKKIRKKQKKNKNKNKINKNKNKKKIKKNKKKDELMKPDACE